MFRRVPYPARQLKHPLKVPDKRGLTPNAEAVLYDYYALPEELSGDGRAAAAVR